MWGPLPNLQSSVQGISEMARLIFWPCLASYCVQRNRGEDAVRKGEKGKVLEKDNKLTYPLKVMTPLID